MVRLIETCAVCILGGLIGAVGALVVVEPQIGEIETRVVGKTPEGFHRRDAAELCDQIMQSLGAVEPVCHPYKAPGYLNHPFFDKEAAPE